MHRYLTSSLGLLLLLSNCAGDGPSDESEQPAQISPENSEEIINRAFAVQPFHGADAGVLFATEQAIVSSCMAERGLPYSPPIVAPASSISDAEAAFPVLPSDEQIARYGLLAVNSSAAVLDEARLAEGGAPEGSDELSRPTVECSELVQRRLDEAVGTQLRETAQPLLEELSVLVQTNDLLTETNPVVAEWSACMTEAGFAVRVPYDLAAAYPSVDGPPGASEVLAATADRDCRASTGFREKIMLTVANRVAVWLDERAPVLKDLEDLEHATLDRLVSLAQEYGVAL